jgi:hypothetical protein
MDQIIHGQYYERSQIILTWPELPHFGQGLRELKVRDMISIYVHIHTYIHICMYVCLLKKLIDVEKDREVTFWSNA